ncbi:hypothetical protein BLA60_18405 [Actinophytocola xinjiangensis]|uniref:Cytochrome P450 n=1 Tax=Actinophytocola xinjiangensis TaxID=485602 RepID=A0A7Z0WM01_9PSEU|nr:cytochrome P450 [Actinophytocola xinjiangensis]OLF09753.1 hypothetical protein BLA60_18405 [Actinophytocola xinjiangensis]
MSAVDSVVDVADLESDPDGVYARLRRDDPVARVPSLDLWLVTRWADVRRVLSSPDSFATAYPSTVAQICGQDTMLATEGDRHAELRAALDDHFSPEMVPALVETTGAIAAEHAAALSGRDGAELMTEYFRPVLGSALGRFLGLGDLDPATLLHWSEDLLDGFDNPTGDPDRRRRAEATAREVASALRPLVDHPNGPLSVLVRRSPTDLLPTLVNIVSALAEPVTAAGSTLLELLRHPDQLRAVHTNPNRLRDAVREGLRLRPPVATLGRVTTRPVTLAGRDLPEGAVIAAAVASANRDEDIYDNANHFDIDRPALPNTGLGYGRHRCLAAAVLPAVIATTLRALLTRVGPPLLTDDARPYGWKVRKLDTLKVRLT